MNPSLNGLIYRVRVFPLLFSPSSMTIYFFCIMHGGLSKSGTTCSLANEFVLFKSILVIPSFRPVLKVSSSLQANVTQIEVNVPHKHHNAVIGAKGRLIRSIMDECGGVSIKFPPEGSNSDKVLIRGPKDDVEKAKKQLLDLLNEKVWIRIVNKILLVNVKGAKIAAIVEQRCE